MENNSRHQKVELGKKCKHGLSQDLESWCLKLAIVKLLGTLFFKGDNNILR